MVQSIQGEIITQEEAVIKLINQDSLANIAVSGLYLSGWKVDHAVDMSKMVCSGTLALGGSRIEGELRIVDAIIKDDLYLDGTEIKGDIILSRTSIGSKLDLEGAVIEGDLYLYNTIINGSLNLVTKKGPRKIFVSPDMANLVHWAAPKIPLVVVR